MEWTATVTAHFFAQNQNPQGYLLDELIANNILIIENVDHYPTFESRGTKICIDVTPTMGLRQAIKDCNIDRWCNGSDHNYIKFSLQTEIVTIPKISQWHKADWEIFRSKINKPEYKIRTVLHQGSCEDILNKLYISFNNSMKKAIPKSKSNLVDRNNLWWNDKLKQLRKTVGKAISPTKRHT